MEKIRYNRNGEPCKKTDEGLRNSSYSKTDIRQKKRS